MYWRLNNNVKLMVQSDQLIISILLAPVKLVTQLFNLTIYGRLVSLIAKILEDLLLSGE